MIPRPPSAVAGDPPPWRPRPGITLASVVEAVVRHGLDDGSPNPGGPDPAAADAGSSAVLRPSGARLSAVLVALFEEGGEARVVLTRRAETLRTHQGQISFPGGRIDPGEGVVEAALREAREEVSLDPAAVRPVGVLRATVTASSGVPILPVVATLARRPALSANPDEVARIFDVSLAALAAAFHEERWTRAGRDPTAVAFFDVATETVWGATARVLVDLLTLVLAGSGPATTA